jgi:hypothetical protein
MPGHSAALSANAGPLVTGSPAKPGKDDAISVNGKKNASNKSLNLFMAIPPF